MHTVATVKEARMGMEILQQRRAQRKWSGVSLAISAGVLTALFFIFDLPSVLPQGPTEIKWVAPPAPLPPKVRLKPPVITNPFTGVVLPDHPWKPGMLPATPYPETDEVVVPFELDPLEPIPASLIDPATFTLSDPTKTLLRHILPDLGGNDPGVKTEVTGAFRRLSGRTAIATLDLPGTDETYPWGGGELDAIADFVSRNTNLRLELGARAISFVGQNACFDIWVRDAQGRGYARAREIGRRDPELDALEALADAVACAQGRKREEFRSRVRQAITGYLRARYDARFDPVDEQWLAAIDSMLVRPLHRTWIADGEQAFKQIQLGAAPSPTQLRDLYLMLRYLEMAQLPVLFCEPRGVPATLHPETYALLRGYLDQGGFVYFANTADYVRARAIRGIVTSLIDEQLDDSIGLATLSRMRQNDQELTGFEAREPEPRIGHPWAFFPMIIPTRTDLVFTVYNRNGAEVFRRELTGVEPNAYLQKHRHFRWHMCDNTGAPLESGFYIYRIEAGLFRQTGAVGISSLRMLRHGQHGIYSSYFNISEVPASLRVKSEQLTYGEPGLFGVSQRGRLAIVYAEGYGEKDALRLGNTAASEASLKWMSNVVMHALSERALAR
jgi:hypothetical protein